MKLAMPRIAPSTIAFGLFMLVAATTAYADSMPWEGPICKIASSFSGPVAKSISVIAIVICGLLMAFGELGGVFKTILGLLMGVTMAVAAVQWMSAFTSTGSSGLGCTMSAIEAPAKLASVRSSQMMDLSLLV